MKLKTFYVRAAAAAAAALLFLYPFPAHAADSAALQGQVSAAQREYESAASTLDSMQQQASDTRQQVNDLQSQTDALRGQLGSIVAQLEQSRTELAEAQNQATAAAKALEEKQAAFSARYDSCKQQLTAMQLLNEGGEISLLMQADDLYELLTFWQVLNDLTEHNKQLLDELDAEAQALDTQRQQAEAAATQAEQAAQALQARQDELTQTQIQLEQALQQASTELDSQQAAAEAQAAVTEEKRKAYETGHRRAGCLLKSAEPEIPGSRPPLQFGFHLSPAQRGAHQHLLWGAGCCIQQAAHRGRHARRQRHPHLRRGGWRGQRGIRPAQLWQLCADRPRHRG